MKMISREEGVGGDVTERRAQIKAKEWVGKFMITEIKEDAWYKIRVHIHGGTAQLEYEEVKGDD